MSKELQEAHISFCKDNSIIVTKPDKGKGVVVLNRTDYVSKMDDILSDASKFSLSSNDDNLHNLTKFQRFLYTVDCKKTVTLVKKIITACTPLQPVPHLYVGYPKHTSLATQ